MIFGKVARILADILDLDFQLEEEQITLDMALTPEFDIEKIQMVKLVMECEKNFKISIQDEKVHTFHTLGEFVKYIENAVSENEGNIAESSEEERMWWHYS